jgi:hypothetical protein
LLFRGSGALVASRDHRSIYVIPRSLYQKNTQNDITFDIILLNFHSVATTLTPRNKERSHVQEQEGRIHL